MSTKSIDEHVFRYGEAVRSVQVALAGRADLLDLFNGMLGSPDGVRREPSLGIYLADVSTTAVRDYLDLIQHASSPPAPPPLSSEPSQSTAPPPRSESAPTPAPPAPTAPGPTSAPQDFTPPRQLRTLAEVFAELGHTLRAAGDDAAAAAAFGSAVEQAPQVAELQVYLAEAQRGAGRASEAIHSYLAAARLDPPTADGPLAAAFDVLRALNARDGAALNDWIQQEWRASVRLDTLDSATAAVLYRFCGRANVLYGHYAPALADLARARAALPDDVPVLQALGAALWHEGQVSEAEVTLSQALELADRAADPAAGASTRAALAELLLQDGRADQARDILQQALTLQPASPELQVMLGQAFVALADWPAARQAADTALATSATLAGAYAVRACALVGLHEYPAAAAAADAALAIDAECLPAMRAKATALLSDPDAGRSATESPARQATQLLTQYTRKQPDDTQALRELVTALRKDGRSARRIVTTLKQAIATAPAAARPALQIDLAEAGLDEPRDKRSVAVIDLLHEAVAAQPQLRTARWWRLLGNAHREAGDIDAALAAYTAGLAVGGPPDDQLALLERYADTLSVEQRWAEAVRAWQMAVDRAPSRAEWLVRLAEGQFAVGNQSDALVSVRRALDLEVGGADRSQAVLLQCQIVEALGRPAAERVAAYAAAADVQLDQNADAAIETLQRARAILAQQPELKAEHLLIYWQLADALVSQSLLPQAPYVLAERVQQAVQVWEEGAQAGTPAKEQLWSYLTRARISELLARLPDQDGATEFWKALAFIERAMLLHDDWSVAAPYWAALARYARLLSLNSNSLLCSERALQADPDYAPAQDERIAILTNAQRLDDADVLIGQRGEVTPNDWVYSIKAYTLYQRGRYRQAIQFFSATLDIDEGDVWSRTLLASCYRLLNEVPRAREEFARVWARRGEAGYAGRDDRNLIATAGYVMAMISEPTDHDVLEEAAAIFTTLVERSPLGAPAMRDLGLCLVALGRLAQAEQQLTDGIAQTTSRSELEFFLTRDLALLSSACAAWPYADGVRALIGRMTQTAQARLAEVKDQPSPLDELKTWLAVLQAEDRSQGWATTAVQAGIARLAANNREWDHAVRGYAVLRPSPLFPEATAAVQRFATAWRVAAAELVDRGQIADGIQALTELARAAGDVGLADEVRTAERLLGNAYLRQPDYAAALHHFRQALAALGATSQPEQASELHSRAAYAAFRGGDLGSSRQHLERAIQARAGAGFDAAIEAVAATQRSLLASVPEFWEAIDTLEDAWQRSAGDPAWRAEVHALRDALFGYLDASYGLGPLPEDQTPPVPGWIVLEIGSGLVPADTSTTTWALFTTHIPGIRMRIMRDRGVWVPAVRVRQSGSPVPGAYTILLNETPVAGGEVDPQMGYCPIPPYVLPGGLFDPNRLPPAVDDPLSAEPGCWIPQERWFALEAAGVPLWHDPLVFVCRHLEAVLRDNLGEFLGVQEIDDLIERWVTTEADRSLVQAALPIPEDRLRFGRVARELADDSVSLVDWRTILSAIQSGLRTRPIAELVDLARLAVRDHLPGVKRPTDQVWLSPALDDQLLRCAAGAVEQIVRDGPLPEMADCIEALRAELAVAAARSPHVVLVTRYAANRPLLRRLITAEVATAAVLTDRELQPSRAPAAAGAAAPA